MNIILYASQNIGAIALSADCCIFARFGVGSPRAVHSDDGRFDSEGKQWSHVSSIVTYRRINSGFLWRKSTVQNRLLGVAVGRLGARIASIFNRALTHPNIHA